MKLIRKIGLYMRVYIGNRYGKKGGFFSSLFKVMLVSVAVGSLLQVGMPLSGQTGLTGGGGFRSILPIPFVGHAAAGSSILAKIYYSPYMPNVAWWAQAEAGKQQQIEQQKQYEAQLQQQLKDMQGFYYIDQYGQIHPIYSGGYNMPAPVLIQGPNGTADLTKSQVRTVLSNPASSSVNTTIDEVNKSKADLAVDPNTGQSTTLVENKSTAIDLTPPDTTKTTSKTTTTKKP